MFHLPVQQSWTMMKTTAQAVETWVAQNSFTDYFHLKDSDNFVTYTILSNNCVEMKGSSTGKSNGFSFKH